MGWAECLALGRLARHIAILGTVIDSRVYSTIYGTVKFHNQTYFRSGATVSRESGIGSGSETRYIPPVYYVFLSYVASRIYWVPFSFVPRPISARAIYS